MNYDQMIAGTMDGLCKSDAVDLIQAYSNGSVTPAQVVAELMQRIASDPTQTNSFCLLSDYIEQEAAESTQRWKMQSPKGMLDGVPIIVKDNLAVSGMPASWGNAELARRMINKDELPIARLRNAGALILGKANTPEFAVEGYTANALFGITRNPFNTNLTPGGSSGGVAAAVASGLATIGIGTDGGGSIRRPAAYCGLIGLKPGLGHVPRANGLPQVLLDFEVVGSLTRTVRDSRLVDSVLQGASREDPLSRKRIQFKKKKTLRILYVPRFKGEVCDAAILSSVESFTNQLANLGHQISEGELPLNLDTLTANWSAIAEIGLSRLFDNDRLLAESASEKYKAMASQGRLIKAQILWDVLQTITQLRIEASKLFALWDIIVTPACSAMPWEADKTHPTVIDGVSVGPRGHAAYSGWVNAIGHPALSLPALPDAEGMPIGVQLVGDLGSESLLLDIAEEHVNHYGGFNWP